MRDWAFLWVTASHKMLVNLTGLKGNCVGDQHVGPARGYLARSPQHPQVSVIPVVLLKSRSIRWFAECSRLQSFFLTTEYRWNSSRRKMLSIALLFSLVCFSGFLQSAAQSSVSTATISTAPNLSL